MAFGWTSSRGTKVSDLLARKKYDKVAEILREQIAGRKGGDVRLLKLHLADVLVKGGGKAEAVLLLMDLADQLVRAHAPARAVSVLKRLQALQPERTDAAHPSPQDPRCLEFPAVLDRCDAGEGHRQLTTSLSVS